MKILVCGDRNWSNQKRLNAVLDQIDGKATIEVLIEGEARGADTLGRLWAQAKTDRNILVEEHPADWNTYHKGAGPRRNKEMLASGPDLVVAFHNDITKSKGTKNMIKIALKAKVPVVLYSETSSRYFDATKIFVEGIDIDKLLEVK